MFELNKKDVEKSKKEFEKLLDGYFSEKRNISEGKVTKGKVVALEKGFVIVDVGLKAEGKIPIREFTNLDENVDIKVGDEIEVFVEKIENILGFRTDYSVKNGAKEIYQALQDNIVTDNIKTKTVEWYKHLLNNPEDSKKFFINNTLF